MKHKKDKPRAIYVAGDSRKRRLHQLLIVCVVLLLPTLYLFYSLSELYLLEIFFSNDIPLDEFGTGIDGDGKTQSGIKNGSRGSMKHIWRQENVAYLSRTARKKSRKDRWRSVGLLEKIH